MLSKNNFCEQAVETEVDSLNAGKLVLTPSL
jgi:hypothetical protein